MAKLSELIPSKDDGIAPCPDKVRDEMLKIFAHNDAHPERSNVRVSAAKLIASLREEGVFVSTRVGKLDDWCMHHFGRPWVK
jgi:hypothetical protein